MANPEIRPLKLDGEIFYPPTISEQVIDPETNESVKFQISELNENLAQIESATELYLDMAHTGSNVVLNLSDDITKYKKLFAFARNGTTSDLISTEIPVAVFKANSNYNWTCSLANNILFLKYVSDTSIKIERSNVTGIGIYGIK